MLALYHNHTSTCSQKVRLVLAEKSLPWESRHLDLRAGDQQRKDYLALNPRGVVPTLIHEGLVIRESNVILEYLDDAFPFPPLRAPDPYWTAEMRLWLKKLDEGYHDIATATMSMGIAFRYQYLEQGVRKCRALIDKIPDPIRRERRRDVIFNGVDANEFFSAVGMWVRLFDEMEEALVQHAWLAGESYGLADAAYTPYLTRLEHLQVLEDFLYGKKRVGEWYERVRHRQSYQEAVIDWQDRHYLHLMASKGSEARQKVRKLINYYAKRKSRESKPGAVVARHAV